MHETNWLPGIVALAAGLLVGLIIWLRMHKGGSARAEAVSEEVADLLARKESLVARLRELQAELAVESDGETAKALGAERQRVELEAAEVLRALRQAENRKAAPAGVAAASEASKAEAPEGFLAARPVLRGYLWGAGTMSFLFVLAIFLLDFLPGGESHIGRPMGAPPTGGDSVVAASRAQAGQPDAELDGLMKRAAAEPTNLEAKLDVAQALVFRDALVDAFEVVQEVQRIEPENARALTYESVVRLAMGQGERALELLAKAVAKDPTLTEAWVRRGLTAFELENYQLAVDSWERALEQRPDGAPALRPVIEEAKLRLSGVPSSAREAAPAAAEAKAPEGAAPAGGSVKLSIELDPASAEKVVPGSTLFVYARPAGVTSGPPVAAKRMAAASFPVEIDLGPADTMMGQPFPEKVAIEARLDRDGDAMTRDPADPVGSADGLVAGQPATAIVLK